MTTRSSGRLRVGWLVALAAAALATGCGDDGSEPASAGGRTERRATIDSCPAFVSAALDPSQLVDRELVPLTQGLHGRRVRYQLVGGTVDLYTGVAVQEQVEDLDFSGGPEAIAGREVVFLQSDSLPHLRLAQWNDPSLDPPCDLVSVFAQGVDPTELRRVIAGIEKDSSEPVPEEGVRSVDG